MANLSALLAFFAALLVQGVSAECVVNPRPAAETASEEKSARPEKAREDEPRSPTTKRTTTAETFYKPGTVQVIHLQVLEADLAKMQSALPERI